MNDTDTTTEPKFSKRAFVAMIRANLDAGGHNDIAIDRLWFEEDTPGYRFLVNVPVGPALTVPLRPLNDFDEIIYGLEREATSFTAALVNLRKAEVALARYARNVERAAVAVIADARADGLDLLLDGVGFKPTYAHQLSGASWKEAISHVLAAVRIRQTSFYLRPEVCELWGTEADNIAAEMEEILVQQRERQDRLAALNALGADLEVDAITIELLETHGLQVADVLRDVWRQQCVNLTVRHRGEDVPLSLISFDGKVTASIQLKDAIWNGEHLWFRGDEHLKDHKALIGQSVGDLVRHPVFASRPIIDVFNRNADHVVFDLSDKLLFDADSGRLWREERLAA